jgi:aminopeptidase N
MREASEFAAAAASFRLKPEATWIPHIIGEVPSRSRHFIAIPILFAIMLPADRARAQDPVGPGVPLILAQERATRLRDVRYELRFVVPETMKEEVTGTVTVRFELTDPSRPLALDFAGRADGVRDVRTAAGPIAVEIRNEHVVVPASALRQGANAVTLSFVASDLALNRNPEFLYTLFVPARARLAFPCFDQPDLKARYRLSLELPADWPAVSNGAETARAADGARATVTFAETPPLSTYLFAFAAGRFQVETAERNGRRFRMLHRETDAAKVARNRDTVFDLHSSALDWLERYTGIPYPFGKFDFAVLPSFQFGGMEHPGSIFYNASSVLLDPSATTNQQLGRASLIAHETAHMWFGDLVTMRWFDDVWMKEVFANFMAAKIVNPSFPQINHQLRFLYAHYPAAYDVDRTPGTNAIRQPLENLNEAGSLYGAIIYQKAPIVMRQLEMIVTAEGLRDGLRDYLRRHAYGNASWPDLIELLDQRTSEDLAAWSGAWVSEAGRPTVTTEIGPAGGIAFRQQNPASGPGMRWVQRVEVASGGSGIARTESATLGREARTSLPAEPAAARSYVLPTGGGIGYGNFVLDPASRAYLTAHLADVADPVTRGAALVTLWEEMLDGRVSSAALFQTLMAALPREADELSVQRMLSYAQQAFWKFLPDDARKRQAAGFERLLRDGLDRATTQSLKSAWFNALRDTARTEDTLRWLERVWRKTEQVPGLTLAEPDYMTLALELAVREVGAWQQILDEQHARIENPDRRAQFAFVRPALSADAATRDAFFASLADVNSRRREAWVLQAVNYLHHPLRAAAAERYIRPSLELLVEIQRTGDIFFPKRWMDATLSGHRSASAAQTVSEFLGKLPASYQQRLRRIILSSSDDLIRARRIQER